MNLSRTPIPESDDSGPNRSVMAPTKATCDSATRVGSLRMGTPSTYSTLSHRRFGSTLTERFTPLGTRNCLATILLPSGTRVSTIWTKRPSDAISMMNGICFGSHPCGASDRSGVAPRRS